jgi:Amt family ammonium transporter
MKRIFLNAAALATGAILLAAPALAAPVAEVAEVVTEVVEAAPAVPNPGNNAWMMTSTILVLLMILPGLALFFDHDADRRDSLSCDADLGDVGLQLGFR